MPCEGIAVIIDSLFHHLTRQTDKLFIIQKVIEKEVEFIKNCLRWEAEIKNTKRHKWVGNFFNGIF